MPCRRLLYWFWDAKASFMFPEYAKWRESNLYLNFNDLLFSSRFTRTKIILNERGAIKYYRHVLCFFTILHSNLPSERYFLFKFSGFDFGDFGIWSRELCGLFLRCCQSQTTQLGMVRGEFQKIMKGSEVALSRFYPGICLDRLRKNKKTLNRDSLLAEILPKHHLDTSLQLYLYIRGRAITGC
jgi:hypothetical protein